MDLDDEINKIAKKLDVVKLSVDKLQKTMGQSNYEEVIPENVRDANAEKVCCRLTCYREIEGLTCFPCAAPYPRD